MPEQDGPEQERPEQDGPEQERSEEKIPEIDKSSWAKPMPERLPRPTAWPATMALGITLLTFGIVTHWLMSVAGLILLVMSIGGWFGDLRNDLLL